VADRDEARQAARVRARARRRSSACLAIRCRASSPSCCLRVHSSCDGRACSTSKCARSCWRPISTSRGRQAPGVPACADERARRARTVPNQNSAILDLGRVADGLIDNPAGQSVRRATPCASCRTRSCCREAARAVFRALRERVGRSEETVDVPTTQPGRRVAALAGRAWRTVDDRVHETRRRAGGGRPVDGGRRRRVAREAEVAFFPPVTGG